MEEETDHQELLASETDEENEIRIKIPKRKIVVEPVLFLFALLNFPFISLEMQYIIRLVSEELGVNHTAPMNHSECRHPNHTSEAFILKKKVQSEAAYFSMILNIVRTFPAVFMSLLLGSYSDKAGRKIIMIIPMCGLLLNVASFCLVSGLHWPKWVLIIGSFAEGTCGSMMAVLLGCLSYLADIIPHQNRAFRMTVAELCLFFPIIFSSAATGELIKLLGFFWPFIIVLCGTVFNIIYIFFFVPETIMKSPGARFFNIGYVKNSLIIFFKDDGSGRRPKLQFLLSSIFFPMVAVMASSALTIIFVSDMPLCWDSVLIGIHGAVYMSVVTIGGGFAARVLKICLSDGWIAFASGLLTFAGFVYTAFVQNTLMMFFGCLFSILFQVFVPTLRAMISNQVQANEHGAAFSGISAVEAIASLVGQSVFNPIYSKTNTFMPGLVYLCVAVFQLVGTILVLIYMKKYGAGIDNTMVKRNQSVN